MSDNEWIICGLLWVVFGVLWCKYVTITPAFQSIMVETKGYPVYAGLMRLCSLLFWPVAPWVSTLMLLAIMKYLKIPIEYHREKDKP